MAKFLWSSVAVLFLALILLAVFTRYDPGSPPLLLNPSVPLVHEGVAMEMICGKQLSKTANAPGKAAALPAWADERWTQRKRQGDCVVYYHHLRAGD